MSRDNKIHGQLVHYEVFMVLIRYVVFGLLAAIGGILASKLLPLLSGVPEPRAGKIGLLATGVLAGVLARHVAVATSRRSS